MQQKITPKASSKNKLQVQLLGVLMTNKALLCVQAPFGISVL